MAYTPPTGSNLILDFDLDYSPPSPTRLVLDTGVPIGDVQQAGGIAATAVPSPVVQQDIVVRPSGVPSPGIPFPDVYPPFQLLSFVSVGDQLSPPSVYQVSWDRTLSIGSILPNIWRSPGTEVTYTGGYQPPPPDLLVLNWQEGSYSIPPASNVVLEFGSFGADLVPFAGLGVQTTFGTPFITQDQGAYTIGIFPTDSYGTPTIENLARSITPLGIDSFASQTHEIELTAVSVEINSIDPIQPPEPVIEFRTRVTTPASIEPPDPQVIAPYVAFFAQFLPVESVDFISSTVGQPEVVFRTRYVSPPYIHIRAFGTPELTRGLEIAPTPWESSVVPTKASLESTTRIIRHASGAADPAFYGATEIFNDTKTLQPPSILNIRQFFVEIRNEDRYIYPQYFGGTNAPPEVFGDASAQLRDRTIAPYGFDFSRFGYTFEIENLADAYLVPSIQSLVFGTQDVDYVNRTLELDGFVDSVVSLNKNLEIYNSGRAVYPEGLSAENFGSLAIEDPLQTIEVLSIESLVLGTPLLGYDQEIFWLVPRNHFDTFGTTDIRYDPAPITPASWESYQSGAQVVEEIFRTITPGAIDVSQYPTIGRPDIRNRNREVYPVGLDLSLYARPDVQLYERYVQPAGFDASRLPTPDIADRARTVRPAPTAPPVFSVYHRIDNLLPEPPGDQYIQPTAVYLGDDDYPGLYGVPEVRANALYPSGFVSSVYGSASVRSFGIFPPSILDLDQLGEPSFSGAQYVAPGKIPVGTVVAKPRVSPHNVYAPRGDEATAQARANHPTGAEPHVIDAFENTGVGQPDVANEFRSVYPSSAKVGDRVGTPALQLGLRYIHPRGIRSQRFGWITFGLIPQYITLDRYNQGIPPDDAFGVTRIEIPIEDDPPAAQGFESLAFGATHIELQNRPVYPDAFTNIEFGGTYVGFHQYLTIGCFDFLELGVPTVTRGVRKVCVCGFDASDLRYDIGAFDERMVVMRSSMTKKMTGNDMSDAGFPSVLLS